MNKRSLGSTNTFVLSVFVFVIGALRLEAGTVTVFSVDRGWYFQTGFHDPVNTGYLTGWDSSSNGNFAGFHVFNPSVSGVITSATLRIFNPPPGAPPTDGYGYHGDATESLYVVDVVTSIPALVAGTAGFGGYSDLASGYIYGSTTVSAANNGTLVSIPMNAYFLSQLNAANDASSQFAVGTVIGSISGTGNQYIFGGGFCGTCSFLDLNVEPDADDDEVPDAIDNCINVANSNQSNVDGDALGDACDPCPTIPIGGSDCQPNSMDDDCELALGKSLDCNANNIPDECEILVDCNSNLQPDICDIATGTSADCNVNGVPDECESPNCNADLVLFDINSGGTRSSGGVYALTASTAQHGGVGKLTSFSNTYTLADGFWHAAAPAGCPCTTLADCRNSTCMDDNGCNHATCVSGTCVFTCERYGDVQPAGGNGIVNIDDILCILGGFASYQSCPNADINPCGGNATINLDDILSVLVAFAGGNPCSCTENTSPGAGVPALCGSSQP